MLLFEDRLFHEDRPHKFRYKMSVPFKAVLHFENRHFASLRLPCH